MKTFIVTTYEQWQQGYRVQAEDAEDAKDRILKGEGVPVPELFEHGVTMGETACDWPVEEEI